MSVYFAPKRIVLGITGQNKKNLEKLIYFTSINSQIIIFLHLLDKWNLLGTFWWNKAALYTQFKNSYLLSSLI